MEKDLNMYIAKPKKRSAIKSALKEGLISSDMCTNKGFFWTSCMIGVGIAGSLASKLLYQGPYSNLVHGYGHDVALPFIAYWSTRSVGGGKLAASLVGFLGCALFEFSQYLGSYPGTYDPNDFIAYASGAGLALTVDKLVFCKHKKKTLEEKIE